MKKLIVLLFLPVFFLPVCLLAQTNSTRMLSGVNYQTGTSYTFVPADVTRVTSFSNDASITAVLPSGLNPGFGAGSIFTVNNTGLGTLAIVCSGCTINGISSLPLTTLQGADIYGDIFGNYTAVLGTGIGGGGGGGGAITINTNSGSGLSGGGPSLSTFTLLTAAPTVRTDTPSTFTTKQTFTSGVGGAGVNFGTATVDPTSPGDGDWWWNSGTNLYCYNDGSVTHCVMATDALVALAQMGVSTSGAILAVNNGATAFTGIAPTSIGQFLFLNGSNFPAYDGQLTDNGTTLTYTGTGGIVTSKLSLLGVWYVNSVLPGSGITTTPGQSVWGVNNDGNFYLSNTGGTLYPIPVGNALAANSLPIVSQAAGSGAPLLLANSHLQEANSYDKFTQSVSLGANSLGLEFTTAAGTYNVGDLACVTASNTLGSCGSTGANARTLGILLAKDGSLPVYARQGAAVTVNSSASTTWTQNDYVCVDPSNAGKSIDNGSAACVTTQVGFVAATDGSSGTTHIVALAFGNAVVNTQTIANGTAALGTSAISSGTCASVVTSTAAGVATTDNIQADFNADPTSTTGYSASSNGMLTIIKYPTSGNVNFKVCNNTASTVTPGAVTLNWRVVR